MKKHLLLFAMILLPLVASAEPVEIDGIYYNLIAKGNVAEVTKNPNKYTGSITIPEYVTYNDIVYDVIRIGYMAFYNCSSLYSITIPNCVTSIDQGAFYQCTGLASINIPSKLTSIGGQAFFYCQNLNTVNITDIAAWCKINFQENYSNPLWYAKHLFVNGEEVNDLVIPNSVTSIGKYAFFGCAFLTSVTIPNSVKSIGSFAFSGCTNLTSVTIPNSVKSIGNTAFESCSGLTTISIPNSITSIESEVFRFCSGLTTISIPNSVTSIESRAFHQCKKLTQVVIGCGIKSIRQEAFASCPELTDVTCYAENVPSTNTDAFKDSYIEYATLHVPSASVNAYKAADPWKNFKNIIETNPTGIKAIENTQSKNTTIYDLNGVRQSEPKKGINIINGKKVVIK